MSSRARERRSDYRRKDEVAAHSRRHEDRDRDRQQSSYQSQTSTTYPADPYYPSQAATAYPANPGYQSQATATYRTDSYPPSQASITYPADLSYQSQSRSVSPSPQPSYHNSSEILDVTYTGPRGSGTRAVPMASNQYASAEAQYGYQGAYVAASARMRQDHEDRDWCCPSCQRSVPATIQSCPHCTAQRPNGQQTGTQTQSLYPQAQSTQGGGRDASRWASPTCGNQEGMPLRSRISLSQAVPSCSRCQPGGSKDGRERSEREPRRRR